jgi:microcystin-dependent protein
MAARPRFVQARKSTILAPITESDVEITLTELVDIYDNALAFADFGVIAYLTIDPGGTNEEIISFTALTQNDDGTCTLTGVTRGLKAIYPYASGGTARPHGGGDKVIVTNNPQLLEAILAYIDGISIAGAANATTIAQGLVELATSAEINAGTTTGGTGAGLSVTPDQLAASNYGTRLPDAAGAAFAAAVTGMIIPYGGDTAPSGFLLCDGTSYAVATYPTLAGVLKGRYGYGSGQTFTADAGTDFITAVSHGLSNGDRIFVGTTNTLPAGLSANTVYYVINKTTNTFQLSTSSGGAAIDITTTGTGTHTLYTSIKVPNLRSSFPMGKGQKTVTFTFDGAVDVDPGTDEITVASNTYLQTGQAVALTGSSLPTGLSATTYYVIRVSATVIQLATTLANALAGTPVNITADGSGTCTLTLTLTSRSMGAEGGEETHALTIAEIPSHTHAINNISPNTGGLGSTNIDGTDDSGTEFNLATAATGGSTAHNIVPPFVVVEYLIKT